MHPISANVLESIGGTPLIQLGKVVPSGHARIVVKLEGANPTGNMKDRMAKAAIEAAERFIPACWKPSALAATRPLQRSWSTSGLRYMSSELYRPDA